ncbi:MAG: restriction endonuclease subunit S [Bacteroidales bacterium]|nr:restriction endonuclease subunit S [Bacteroidales bacterium]MDY6427856.1 restriction endonuclease subunit S [Bacteroidales bacterium]
MKELRIKDICDKGSSNLKQKDVEGKNGLYPVYGASGIISHIDTYHQEANYIAIVKDGSGIGRVSFMPAKSSVIGTMQYILPKEGFNINYIGYCLQSLDLSKYKQGAAIPHIYFRDYGERIVKVTEDINEQQSIVDYLDSAFAKIDAMKANAEKALDEANALFQASLKEMLEPKEGWEETALKELGQTQTGTTPSKSDKVNYGDFMEFIRPSEIDCDGIGSINYNCEMKLSKQGASKGRIFNSNSIFMVCIGATIGKVGFSTKNISCNQQINVFTPKEKINYKFAYYAMKSPSFQHRVIKEGTSSQATLPIINKGKWEQLSICFPAIKEQEIIVSHLDLLSLNVLKLKTNYNKISQECDALKQAILKQVFE